MSEMAFKVFCGEAQWPREGGRFQAAAMEAWIAAIEQAARRVEVAGCLGPSLCGGLKHHDPRCPIALAAAIRELV